MFLLTPRTALALGVLVSVLSTAAPALSLASPAPAPRSHAPGQVAAIEVQLPDLDSFVLRATLPVPPGLFHEGSATIPIQVRDHDGRLVPTQVDPVSWYPNLERDGADVVEVQALVTTPPDLPPGERHRYAVIHREHEPVRFLASQESRDLLAREQGVQLLARDVFGNRYKTDVLRNIREGAELLRRSHQGSAVQGWESHSIMRPAPAVSGPEGTLPHMMGVHAFVKQWSGEDFLTLDLRIHNGMCGRKESTKLDDALSDIYFDELILRLPPGWRVLHAYEDPFIGEERSEGSQVAHPLIERLPGGKMHVLRSQGQLFRRLALAPEGEAVERARAYLQHHNLGFAVEGETVQGRPFWSWWNDETGRYFPQRQRLPSLAHLDMEPVRGELRSRLQELVGHVATGTGDEGWYPLITDGLGYARPYGTIYGGMAGGVEIDLFAGLEAAAVSSVDGYRLHEIMTRMYIDRQPTSLYELNGAPTKLENWLQQGAVGTYFPGLFNLRPLLPHHDPFGFGDAPLGQNEWVRSQNLAPDYEDTLLSFWAIDIQHWTRYTRNLKVLAWLGNDGLARSEIEMAAEIYRLTSHQYPNSGNGNTTAGWGLLGQMQHVETHPNEGFGFGRASGWGIDVAAAAYSMGTRDLRERFEPWFALTVDLVRQGQSLCGGYLQAQPHHSNGALYRQRQTFETNIGEHGLKAIAESVYRGVDDSVASIIDDVIVRQVFGTVSPAFWNQEASAPHSTVAVGPYDITEPPYCGEAADVWASDAVDGKYPWNSLGYAYQVTGDLLFMTRAAELAGVADLFAHMQANALADIDNRGIFVGLLQSLAD